MKKVLIITYYWPPSGGAGVQRWLKFSKYLNSLGYEPIVVTVDPAHASYPVLDYSLNEDVEEIKVIRTKSFEPFTLYQKLVGKKEIPYAGFANETNPGTLQKIIRSIRGNFFIPDARKGWNKYVLPVAGKLIQEHKIDNLVTTSPPHSTQLIGLKLKNEFQLNWIADLRDPWTDIYYYKLMYHSFIAASKDKQLEQQVLEKADNVVVVSESIKNLFTEKLRDRNGNKIHVIPNGYDEDDFKDVKLIKHDYFTITYTGTLADNYNLDNFLSIISKLNLKDLRLQFVGKVSDKYKEMIHQLGIENQTLFIGHIDHKKAIEYMVSSDLLLLVIPDVPENKGILTGKLFEYLATGREIIGIGPVVSDSSTIINNCQAGKMFDYADSIAIERYINKSFQDWVQDKSTTNMNRCKEFSRKHLTEKIIKLFV